MIAWILLILSGLALGLMFLRRLRLTKQDLRFQESLQEEEAGEEATEALETFPEEQAPELDGSVRKTYSRAEVLVGRSASTDEELGEAEQLLLAVLANEPDHIDAHHKLGLLYLRTGNFQ